jgi:hypothetical protein
MNITNAIKTPEPGGPCPEKTLEKSYRMMHNNGKR